MDKKIVGICRFAFLGRGDWHGMQSAAATDAQLLAKRATMLFDPVRLRQRLFTLEHITLASITGQTDPNFIFVILTSTSLPDEWKQKLTQLCGRFPQAMLLESPETDTESALAPLLENLTEMHGTPPLQFRLDDDDAVGKHFIGKLRTHGSMLDRLPRVAIGFPRGLSVVTHNGSAPTYWRTHRGFTGAGAAARFRDGRKSIFSMNHFMLPQRLPAFTDPSIPGHFVLLWDNSDSAAKRADKLPWGYEEIDETEFRQELTAHFPFLAQLDWTRIRRNDF